MLRQAAGSRKTADEDDDVVTIITIYSANGTEPMSPVNCCPAMTTFAKLVHELRPNQPAATYNYDLHMPSPLCSRSQSDECLSSLRIRNTFKAHPCENVVNVY